MRRLSSLLLLLTLVAGLGATWLHEAHHALEWAEQTSHAADHHGDDDDHVRAPCADGDVHALDCAVCSGLSFAAIETATAIDLDDDDDRQTAAREAYADIRRAIAPARGPPAVA